eukprot:jgi/Undpi1/3149/HiC_scaffold_15.g06523.m1
MPRCSNLRVIQWVTVVLALVCGSSGFVLPSSQAAAWHASSARLTPGVTHDARTRPRHDVLVRTSTHIHRGGVSGILTRTTAAALAASRSGGQGGKDTEDEVEEKGDGGIEPKYLAAICVFALAAFYDLFVTHEGRLWEL